MTLFKPWVDKVIFAQTTSELFVIIPKKKKKKKLVDIHTTMTHVLLLKHITLTCNKIVINCKVLIWTNNTMLQVSICLSDTCQPIMSDDMLFNGTIIVDFFFWGGWGRGNNCRDLMTNN